MLLDSCVQGLSDTGKLAFTWWLVYWMVPVFRISFGFLFSRVYLPNRW